MTAALGFLPSWAWRWIAFVLLAIGFGLFCWFRGDEHGTQKLNDYIAKEAKEDVRIGAARVKIVTVLGEKYGTIVQTIYKKGDTITKDIPVYVTKQDDSGCTVTNGFVRMFDSAWAGAPAGSPLESDRGPSGVPLSEVAAADASNATSCLVYKAQRDGVIEFYRKQQQVK